MENIGTSTYERLHLNNKDLKYYNEIFDLKTLKNDKENSKCAKDHGVEGIIIVLLYLISLHLIINHKIVHSRTKHTGQKVVTKLKN